MKDFIKSRMNKDNLWNLIFWMGMSLGWLLSWVLQAVFSLSQPSSIVFWGTIVIVPLVVTLANRTRFSKEEQFTNSQGDSLKDRMPNLDSPSVILVGVVFASIAPMIFGHFFLFFGALLSVITFSFITINCPISILFNIEFLKQTREYSEAHPVEHKIKHNKTADYVTDPIYRNLSCNIYHKRH